MAVECDECKATSGKHLAECGMAVVCSECEAIEGQHFRGCPNASDAQVLDWSRIRIQKCDECKTTSSGNHSANCSRSQHYVHTAVLECKKPGCHNTRIDRNANQCGECKPPRRRELLKGQALCPNCPYKGMGMPKGKNNSFRKLCRTCRLARDSLHDAHDRKPKGTVVAV